MESYENAAFTVSFITYSMAVILYLIYVVNKHEGTGKLATIFTACGWGINTLALILRGINAERLPLTNGYEFLIAFAWGIVSFYLWFEYRYGLKTVGLFVMPVVWILLAYVAVEMPVSQRAITPLMPALKSNWLSVHVATAILSYGAFALSFGLAVMYLIEEHFEKRPARIAKITSLIGHLPTMELLDELSYRFITFGFFLLSLVIVSGAIWAEQAWGSYWSWDPKETWSLITWLIYGACLHARRTYGWRGHRSLVLVIVGFVSVLFTFFGVNYLLPGLHSYA